MNHDHKCEDVTAVQENVNKVSNGAVEYNFVDRFRFYRKFI